MESDISVDWLRPNTKRTYGQMSREQRSLDAWLPSFHGASDSEAPSSSSFDFHFIPPSLRYPGSGLDFRRPVMSEPLENVIDLTGEPDSPPQHAEREPHRNAPSSNRASRPPRFSRNIIDLDEDGGSPAENGDERGDGSSDVEILSSGPAHSTLRPASRLPSLAGYPARARTAGELHEASTRRPPYSRPSFQYMRSFLSTATRGLARQRATELLDAEEWHRNGAPELSTQLQFGADIHDLVEDAAFAPVSGFQPPQLDFGLQGFRMGSEVEIQPPPPTYHAPPPARQGYTRSPVEEDTIICPNCDEELGTGDDDLKRQVWVVKSCGHVYCGECTKNRHKVKGKQARVARTKPFSRCTVEGCGKQAVSGAKAMFQIYL